MLLRVFVCLTVFSTFVQATYIIPSPRDWNTPQGRMRQHFVSGSNVKGRVIIPDNSCVIQTAGLFNPFCTRRNTHKLARFVLSKKNKRGTKRYWNPNVMRKMIASIVFQNGLFGHSNIKDRRLISAIKQLNRVKNGYLTPEYTAALDQLYAVAYSRRIAGKFINYAFKKPVGITTYSVFRGSNLYYKYIQRSMGKNQGDQVVSTLDLLCYLYKLDFKVYKPVSAGTARLVRQVTPKGPRKRLFAASGLSQEPNARNPYPHMDAFIDANHVQQNSQAAAYSQKHFLSGPMKKRQANFLKSKKIHKKIPLSVRRALKKLFKV